MKSKWIFLISGFLVLLFLYNVNPNEDAFIPDEMAGRWAADSPQYEGCYLDLSPVTVVYHTRKNNVDVHFVQSVEKKAKGTDSLYTIHHKNRAGEEGSISLFWDPVKKEIRLKNQKKMTWKKVEVSS